MGPYHRQRFRSQCHRPSRVQHRRRSDQIEVLTTMMMMTTVATMILDEVVADCYQT